MTLDRAARTHWCFMQPAGRPSFTPALMRDLNEMQSSFQTLARAEAGNHDSLQFFVLASRNSGIFNLGGDLALFAEKIRLQDREALRRYAHTCVELLHLNYRGYDASVTTIALVQGDALGGGFESALAFDMIVAERQARMGLPEVLFNLFPGMGAYSFLSRRLDPVRAEKMILSGQIYTAEELHQMGVVDVLAEPGEGEAEVRRLIAQVSRKRNAYDAVLRARRRVNPVELQELRDVTDIWVEAALRLTDADLRKMERLVAAQDRRCSVAAPQPERLAG